MNQNTPPSYTSERRASTVGQMLSNSNAQQTQTQLLDDALAVVRSHAKNMRRCLDAGFTMDGFRHASLMLATLRTSALTPRNYYELYMAIFDQLSAYLAPHLYDGHINGQHTLSDLYELVQYAGNIVPRLYLMATVGAVYMRVAAKSKIPLSENVLPPPVKEILNDLLEMARGVQHPTRGLFFRYYLSSMTRDYMPNHLVDGPLGTLSTSVHFILQNFIEMNKLWVRLQYIGHSSERDKREIERKELKVIVGSGLVRLSQLEGLEVDLYRTSVLPSLLGEIVSCKDLIAQEYLMDIIIQVFPEDFHFRTLDLLLAATMQLTRAATVKQTVLGLVERFIAYADRTREDAAETRRLSIGEIDTSKSLPTVYDGIPEEVPLFPLFWEQITSLAQTRTEFTIYDNASLLVSLQTLCLKVYPNKLEYIDKILGFAKERVLLAKRDELKNRKTESTILKLLLAPIETYSDNPLKLLKFPSSKNSSTFSHNSLIEPSIRSNSSSFCGNFTDLLRLLPHTPRRKVAYTVAKSVVSVGASNVSQKFSVDSCDSVEALFGELCSVLVTDCLDGNVCGAIIPSATRKFSAITTSDEEEMIDDEIGLLKLDWDDIIEEQEFIAKLIHLVRSPSGHPDDNLELLAVLRQHLGTGGDLRIRFTLPPFLHRCFATVHDYLSLDDFKLEDISERLLSLYQFINETVKALSHAKYVYTDSDDTYFDIPPRFGSGLQIPGLASLSLFLAAAKCADSSGHEEPAYEFVVEAFTCYEESAALDSKTQVSALIIFIGALSAMHGFGYRNYETLVARIAGYAGRLLRKTDQARMLLAVAVLFWEQEKEERVLAPVGRKVDTINTNKTKTVEKIGYNELFGDAIDAGFTKSKKDDMEKSYRNGPKVLECLQKALALANAVLDPAVRFELFVLTLERYVLFYEMKIDTIHIRHLNFLVDLIKSEIAKFDASANIASAKMSFGSSIFSGQPAIGSASGNHEAPRHVSRHFESILGHLRFLKNEEVSSYEEADLGIGHASHQFRNSWNELNI
ncbi:Vacuolar protein sorting-associated protein 35 [Physocladia obscura]|uniref:Vacuolar protein sorting-associated protein 35 n=1 Tax=Physocladia obscura TaxID=109957 RepID=A0AAD5TB53_9FUNG|nr:Vacuolar protein sorting-associated protein 35 [Physocladia obscura]